MIGEMLLYSPQESAELLGISRSQMFELLACGDVESEDPPGGTDRIRRAPPCSPGLEKRTAEALGPGRHPPTIPQRTDYL